MAIILLCQRFCLFVFCLVMQIFHPFLRSRGSTASDEKFSIIIIIIINTTEPRSERQVLVFVYNGGVAEDSATVT